MTFIGLFRKKKVKRGPPYTALGMQRSFTIWTPGTMNKPAKAFYGDSDGDTVMNMFDCQSHNRRKQGSVHEEGTMEPLPDISEFRHRKVRVTKEDRERFAEGVERLNKAAEKSAKERGDDD